MNTARKGIMLTDKQRFHWLRLIRSENVGPQTFRQLIERFGSAEAALQALPELAQKGGKRRIRVASAEDVEREMALAQKHGVRFVGIGEADYPESLRHIDSPPPLLAIMGNAETLNRTAVGIVGSRNASAVGLRLAASFARELGEAGFAIISGFARGIDGAAHKASLKTGTIAVVAGGIDHIYPPEHNGLYQNILANHGIFVSEMPLGWVPRAQDFPRRNRLIAGIALGLLVVEASLRSGSLITARYATDAGRLVFAIPGSPLDPRATGANSLIKNGANLADCPADIIETLQPLVPELQPYAREDLFDGNHDCLHEDGAGFASPTGQPAKTGGAELEDAERAKLLSSLSLTPVDLETLCGVTGISVSKLYLALMELDLAGRLVRHSGGLVSLLPE